MDVISQLSLTYTSEMDKAMFQSHGIGYELYKSSFKERMRVEKRREKQYQRESQYISGILKLKSYGGF